MIWRKKEKKLAISTTIAAAAAVEDVAFDFFFFIRPSTQSNADTWFTHIYFHRICSQIWRVIYHGRAGLSSTLSFNLLIKSSALFFNIHIADWLKFDFLLGHCFCHKICLRRNSFFISSGNEWQTMTKKKTSLIDDWNRFKSDPIRSNHALVQFHGTLKQ